MDLEEIVKTWRPSLRPEFRGFRCGMCQSSLGNKAWHHNLDSDAYSVTLHMCDNCEKAAALETGEYKTFQCDQCAAEITKAWHIWNKGNGKLRETHICKPCGQETYGK